MRALVASLAVLLAAGCTAPVREGSPEVCMDRGTAVAGLQDDRQTVRNLQRGASRLIKEKRTVSAETLRGQLERGRCTLALDSPGKERLTPEEIYRTRRDGVVIVAGIYKCGRCTEWHAAPASGFFITADGAVVTNHHVMEGKDRETYVVGLADGTVLPVLEVLAASKKHDLAILRVDVPEGRRMTAFPVDGDAAVGAPVSIISHPDRKFYTLSCGMVSRHYEGHSHGRGHVPMFTVTADFARGSSGAPVIDERGGAVGVVASTNSVYYEERDGKQVNLQMVFKQCVPATSLLGLIEKPKK